MAKLQLLRGDKAIGLIYVEEGGISIETGVNIERLLSSLTECFVLLGVSGDHIKRKYLFEVKFPASTYFEVLARLRPIIIHEGYGLFPDTMSSIR